MSDQNSSSQSLGQNDPQMTNPVPNQGANSTQPQVDPMAPLFPVGKSADPRDDECLSIFSDEETKAKHAALVKHAIAANNLQFNAQRLLELVASSYSLTYAEKIYFLDIAIGKISQEQVNQLMQVFENEQERFAKLHKEHNEKMAEIQKKYEQNQTAANDPQAKAEKAKAEAEDMSQVQDILNNLD